MVTRIKNVSGANVRLKRLLKSRRLKKQNLKKVVSGIVHIKSSFNNTLVTVTDLKGDTISWSSGGCLGFKGTKKSTPYAAQLAAESAVREAMDCGLKNIKILLKGSGMGREAALRAVQGLGLNVELISDVTPIAHNSSSRLIKGVRKK